MSKISSAQITFNPSGNPISEKFDDIYFSIEDGLQESRYVFQQGNQVVERWLNWPAEQFTIAETGFGTGLNFLAVWQDFENFKQANPAHSLKRLHFISFEKYPLTKPQLSQALKQWPSLQAQAKQLLLNYPSLIAGPHRLILSDSVSLDLWFDDVAENLPKISARPIHSAESDNQASGQGRYSGIIDAWFLDGFAPSKNPDMWQPSLFQQMARLSRENATFATFTAAGFVRRGLIDVGFNVNKRAGFGRKREMLVGRLDNSNLTEEQASTYAKADKYQQLELAHPFIANQASKPKNETKVIIIGGGIAAACTAYSFCQRGYQVELICQGPLADAASGNRQGALYPLLQLQHNTLGEFYAKAFEYSMRFYQQQKSVFDFAFSDCGVLQLAFNQDRQRRLEQAIEQQNWPSSLMNPVDAAQASQIADINLDCPAWHYPSGGWLNPTSFIKGLVNRLVEQGRLKLKQGCQVNKVTKQATGQWQVNYFASDKLASDKEKVAKTTETKQSSLADLMIFTTVHQLNELLPLQGLSLQPVRGQVSHLTSTPELAKLKTVICHKGYLTPSWQQLHCAGASFIKDQTDCQPTAQEDQQNRDQQAQYLSATEIDFNSLEIASARASIRSKTLDHLPVVGNVYNQQAIEQEFSDIWKGQKINQLAPVENGLYQLSGLGSRGLSSAPFLAELLASTVAAEPLPLAIDTLAALQANRFLLKKLKRRE